MSARTAAGSAALAACEAVEAAATEELPRIDEVWAIVLFTLVPALVSLVLALRDGVLLVTTRWKGLLRWSGRMDADTLHLGLFGLEVVVAILCMGAAWREPGGSVGAAWRQRDDDMAAAWQR